MAKADKAGNTAKYPLNLPDTAFPMRGDLPKREPVWVADWEKRDLYHTIQNVCKNRRNRFVLHDGPPYANGEIHLGHALNKILKDIVNKTKLFEGYDVPYVPGWDCHGMPIEIQIEKMYGKEVFYEDAINEVIPDAYTSAVADEKRVIVSRPEFDVVSIDEGGVVLSATYFTKPEVEISDYLGIAVERPVSHATDEEVEEELKRVQTRNSRMIEVSDRPAQKDDTVTIDYEGFCDGVALKALLTAFPLKAARLRDTSSSSAPVSSSPDLKIRFAVTP